MTDSEHRPAAPKGWGAFIGIIIIVLLLILGGMYFFLHEQGVPTTPTPAVGASRA